MGLVAACGKPLRKAINFVRNSKGFGLMRKVVIVIRGQDFVKKFVAKRRKRRAGIGEGVKGDGAEVRSCNRCGRHGGDPWGRGWGVAPSTK